MWGELSRRSRIGSVLFLAFLLTLGLSPSANAVTVCDDANLKYADYTPEVNPAPLDALLNLIGAIPVGMTFDVPIHLLYDHTLHLGVEGSIPLNTATYRVIEGMGYLKVILDLLSWQADMTVAVTHAPCGGDFLCNAETQAIDEFLQWADDPGLSFVSSTVTQIADVCVLQEKCKPVYPLDSTTAAINGFHLTLLPEGDPLSIGAWLNDYISSQVNLTDVKVLLQDFFVTEAGTGLLINVFGRDITKDNWLPVREQIECLTSGCSTVQRPRQTMARSINMLLYGIPVAIMFGLILLARNRKK